MSVRDDLAALCHLEARMSALTEQRDELRRRLLDYALDTLDNEGVAPTWRAGDLGSVSLTMPKAKAEVVDEDAFTAFVAEAYGDGAVEQSRPRTPPPVSASRLACRTSRCACRRTPKRQRLSRSRRTWRDLFHLGMSAGRQDPGMVLNAL